jgi:3-hydroxyacyl-CoA dehydrogenase
MSPRIDRVAIVGCGLIGSGWASWFLAKGLEVTCTDPARGAEARLKNSVAASLAELGHSQADCQQILARLHFEPDIVRAVSAADWIQENAPEDLTVKREILALIDQACRPEAVIASSTSSLKVSDMQVRLSHPERLVVGHPFLPVTLIPLVEVAGGAETAEAVIDAAMAFYRSVDKRPVRLRKEITGHIANRLQAAVMREAFFLLQEGVASAPDIDLAMTEGPGPRWATTGPFVSHELAGGEGGARQTFANLGEAMRAMWADLGSPSLTPQLEARVVAALRDCMAEKSQRRWGEERRRLVRAIQQAKALIESEASSL